MPASIYFVRLTAIDVMKPVFEMLDDQMADVLRQKSEAQRLQIAARMYQSARVILRGAIQTEHPDWDQERVNHEIARRISRGVIDDALR